MRSVIINVTGLVQGVFYRKHTQEQANRLGVIGVVRNLSDGSVEIEASGTPEAIESLIAWCRQGPPRAKVERVEVKETEIKNFNGFRINRW